SASQPLDVTLLRDNAPPVHAVFYAVSEGFFEIFGLPMANGTSFAHDDHVPIARGQPQIAKFVVSHRAWTEWFGRDPAIVGKTIRFAEATGTVAGVAAPDIDTPHGADFWINARLNPQDVGHGMTAVLRTKPGTPMNRLRSELSTVMTGLGRDFPVADAGRAFVVQPLATAIVGDLGPVLLIVLAATVLLLVLACVNVTNLLLARGTARMREVAVRTALGASRGRIMRQLLTESFVVTLIGAAAGLLLAYAGVHALQALGASKLPRLDAVPFDARVLSFALTVMLASGVTLGVAPAIRLANTDVRSCMNEGGRTATAGRGTSRIMGAMTVAEVALAITLVAGAGWLVDSFSKLRATDLGFVAPGRLIVDVRPNPALFQGLQGPLAGDKIVVWSQTLRERLKAVPGVTAVGATFAFPLRGDRDSSVLMNFEGQPNDPSHPTGGRMRMVSPGYFTAMGVQLIAGRDFSDDDRQKTMPVAIVNREFARRFLANRDPLSVRFTWGYPDIRPDSGLSIVGVVGDVRHRAISEPAEPCFYVPQGQFTFPRQTVVVATRASDAATMAPAIRAELTKLDPTLALDIDTVSHVLETALNRQQLGMTLMLLFGAIALTLASVGIYGVIAYASAQRIGEIATRLALGATPTDVFWLMMRRGQQLAIAGVVVGLAAAYAGGRAVAGIVYGIRASDPIVLLTATSVVIVITIVATAIPAIRASRVNPISALRSE
ncbi:MAG TPA: ADOP family duplicated permease, partial [Vicinamibacterales bacterium]|nr:ADOP family duplicated permease [Vicinamibacterales bacterium]